MSMWPQPKQIRFEFSLSLVSFQHHEAFVPKFYNLTKADKYKLLKFYRKSGNGGPSKSVFTWINQQCVRSSAPSRLGKKNVRYWTTNRTPSRGFVTSKQPCFYFCVCFCGPHDWEDLTHTGNHRSFYVHWWIETTGSALPLGLAAQGIQSCQSLTCVK